MNNEQLKDQEAVKTARPAYASWGVRIDTTNPDPETAVEYIGAVAGFIPARGNEDNGWDKVYPYNEIKPCVLKDGKVAGYINPDNYGEYLDGRAVTAEDGDIMVEFPKTYYRIRQDKQFTYVEIADNAAALADGFTDFAFSYNGKVQDKFYVGAYKGRIIDDKLRSVGGDYPTTNRTIGQFRAAAQKGGAGYEITPFNKLVFLQVLYLIRFKSLNSQAAFGKGLTSGSEYGKTGATDTNGLYYGEQDALSRVKCHGLEDFWGNVWERVDGFISTPSAIKIADGNFNDIGVGYTVAKKINKTVYGITTEIYGDSKLGFIPKATKDIAPGKTHYCNWGSVWNDNSLPFFGGSRWIDADAGAFSFSCVLGAGDAASRLGARLCFCGGE